MNQSPLSNYPIIVGPDKNRKLYESNYDKIFGVRKDDIDMGARKGQKLNRSYMQTAVKDANKKIKLTGQVSKQRTGKRSRGG